MEFRPKICTFEVTNFRPMTGRGLAFMGNRIYDYSNNETRRKYDKVGALE